MSTRANARLSAMAATSTPPRSSNRRGPHSAKMLATAQVLLNLSPPSRDPRRPPASVGAVAVSSETAPTGGHSTGPRVRLSYVPPASTRPNGEGAVSPLVVPEVPIGLVAPAISLEKPTKVPRLSPLPTPPAPDTEATVSTAPAPAPTSRGPTVRQLVDFLDRRQLQRFKCFGQRLMVLLRAELRDAVPPAVRRELPSLKADLLAELPPAAPSVTTHDPPTTAGPTGAASATPTIDFSAPNPSDGAPDASLMLELCTLKHQLGNLRDAVAELAAARGSDQRALIHTLQVVGSLPSADQAPRSDAIVAAFYASQAPPPPVGSNLGAMPTTQTPGDVEELTTAATASPTAAPSVDLAAAPPSALPPFEPHRLGLSSTGPAPNEGGGRKRRRSASAERVMIDLGGSDSDSDSN